MLTPFLRRLIIGLAYALVACLLLPAQSTVPPSFYEQVTSAFQQGRLSEAETALRAVLRKDPGDVRALGLLGVVLDAEKQFEEAEKCYTQALALSPGSVVLLNNLGNHYLARGLPDRARPTFLQVLATEPDHLNANLQMARISVGRKDGQAAFRYLEHLPKAEQTATPIQLMRGQALYFSGRKAEAEGLITKLEQQTSGDPRLAFSLGMVFVDWERFQDAERNFSLALRADPTNFDILYNLGLAATRAGHLERAEEVFQAALRQRPNDVDSLFSLARIYAQKDMYDTGTLLLVQAQRLAPERTDIPLLLAHCSEKLAYYEDAATAYEQYLKLRPEDDRVRRERGFALVRGGKVNSGIQDLRWYVQKYPRDVDGLYQLAVAEMTFEPDDALRHLTEALKEKPHLQAARFTRAVLHFQQGRADRSIEDIKLFLKQEPDNVRALDQLGQSYLLLEQAQEAATVLGRAAELAPTDPAVLIHYSRSLRRLGRRDEANRVLERFKALGPEQSNRHSRSGLLNYLNLSPAERQTRYLANLQSSLEANPRDPALKLRFGKAMLEQGHLEEALANFRDLPQLTTDAHILSECGEILIGYRQYEVAKPCLERARDSDPSASQVRLGLALAVFHTAGPKAGLQELDRVPQAERDGDYFLLRAQVLDALDLPKEAGDSLNQAFKTAPTRADLYFQAALFLIKYDKNSEALQLLQQAARLVPETPELMLVQAVLLEIVKQPEEAKKVLARMQSRWPEWGLPYLIQGIILQTHLFFEEAKSMLEIAVSLGEDGPIAYYYLAQATLAAAPEDTEGVDRILSRALELSPEDPYLRLLAGRNAMKRKNYVAAIEHLAASLRYKPDLAEAHYALSASYRASGNAERAATELEAAQRLEKESREDDSAVSSIRKLLFTVRSGRRPS